MKSSSIRENGIHTSNEFFPKPDLEHCNQKDTPVNLHENETNDLKSLKRRKSVICLCLCITAAALLVGIASYYAAECFIAGGIQYSKSPEQALQNYINSISKQDTTLFIQATDYDNSLEDLKTVFSCNDNEYKKLEEQIKEYLAGANNKIAEKYGGLWCNNISIVSSYKSSVEVGHLIKQKIYLTCRITGYDTPVRLTALTTDGIKWFIEDDTGILNKIKAGINN